MSRRDPKLEADEIRAQALEMIATLQDVIRRAEDAEQWVKQVRKRAEDAQLLLAHFANDVGVYWHEVGVVVGKSENAIRMAAQRRRRGQG